MEPTATEPHSNICSRHGVEPTATDPHCTVTSVAGMVWSQLLQNTKGTPVAGMVWSHLLQIEHQRNACSRHGVEPPATEHFQATDTPELPSSKFTNHSV